MSGLFGLLRLDGAPVSRADVETMSALLRRRGPETGAWKHGPVTLGHRSLPTTPEAVGERQPLVHDASGCVLVADVRLDNRAELLPLLDLDGRSRVSDAAIVLAAYLRWGRDCASRLLGDFAFAVWDPRSHELLCARDQIGLRQLIYHHTPGRLLAFATDTQAVLGLPDVPYRINEARIADHLVEGLEGVDTTSTFFEGVLRLPAAHTLTVGQHGAALHRYWANQPGEPLGDDPRLVAEGLLDVLRQAVDARLRTVGPPASMLSGGMDSGSAAAIARTLLASRGEGPLLTFSAVSPLGASERETQAVLDATTMPGIDPTLADHDTWAGLLGAVQERMWAADEPWDSSMAIIDIVYALGAARGARTMLDGVAGDIVLSEGRYLARLIRRGRVVTAAREAVLQDRFWKGGYPARTELVAAMRAALTPPWLLVGVRDERARARARADMAGSAIDPDFARRVAVEERLLALESHSHGRGLLDPHSERARAIDHPYLVVARERYDRVAAVSGIEPRDPFCDLRVIDFCTRIPDGHLLSRGWPKAALRLAVNGYLPDPVRWRTGKENLGWAFTDAAMRAYNGPWEDVEEALGAAAPYVSAGALAEARVFREAIRGDNDLSMPYAVLHMGAWLRRHARRPIARDAPTERGSDP